MSQYRGFGGDDLPDPKEFLDHLRRNGRFILLAVIILALVFTSTGAFFTVEPEERAVVLRFGRPLPADYGPGLHFKVPLVDRVFIVPVERQHRVELGFRSDPGEQTKVDESRRSHESLMLTGDLSLAHVQWSVLYKVKDIRQYLFKVKDPDKTVRDVAMGAMRAVVGDYSLDEMLTGGYEQLSSAAAVQTQRALDAVGSGIRVTAVTIRKTEVPEQAKAAFNKLNETVSKVKQEIREAHARRKQVRGGAEQRRQTAIGRAEADRAQAVQSARGEAAAFLAKLKQYELAPAMTRQWLYLDAMSAILSNTREKLILDDGADQQGVVKLLPLQDMFAAPKPRNPEPEVAPRRAAPLSSAPSDRIAPRGGER